MLRQQLMRLSFGAFVRACVWCGGGALMVQGLGWQWRPAGG